MTAKKSLRGKLAVVIAMYVTLFAAVLAEAEDYAVLVEWVMTLMVYVETDNSTGKSFKAFRANVDTVVVYSFFQDKLSSIHFQINDKRSNQLLQSVITKELTELYRMSPEEEYVAEQYLENGFHIPGKIWRTWKTKGLVVHMSYYDDGGLSLVFGPLQW